MIRMDSTSDIRLKVKNLTVRNMTTGFFVILSNLVNVQYFIFDG
jgi:hypothetical protein